MSWLRTPDESELPEDVLALFGPPREKLGFVPTCFAISGALLSYSLATASPTNIGFDVLTFSATAALIGGVSPSGGKGRPIGIVSSLITGGLLIVVTIVWAPDLSEWFGTMRPLRTAEERS